MATELLEVRLHCLDEDSAQKVIDETDQIPSERRGANTASREGSVVVISYNNKMWPYDIADMAGELGLAGDAESAAVIACL